MRLFLLFVLALAAFPAGLILVAAVMLLASAM